MYYWKKLVGSYWVLCRLRSRFRLMNRHPLNFQSRLQSLILQMSQIRWSYLERMNHRLLRLHHHTHTASRAATVSMRTPQPPRPCTNVCAWMCASRPALARGEGVSPSA